MLYLPEHGGIVVSTRDWLAGEKRMMDRPLKLDMGDKTASEGDKVKKRGKKKRRRHDQHHGAAC